MDKSTVEKSSNQRVGRQMKRKSEVLDNSNEAKVEIKCRLCEEQFTSIESYIQHQKVHFPEDPKEKGKLLCNLCTYSSFIKDHIRKHLMRHYDVKPFKCRFCEWSCVTKHQLTVHHINNHLNLKRSRYAR